MTGIITRNWYRLRALPFPVTSKNLCPLTSSFFAAPFVSFEVEAQAPKVSSVVAGLVRSFPSLSDRQHRALLGYVAANLFTTPPLSPELLFALALATLPE